MKLLDILTKKAQIRRRAANWSVEGGIRRQRALIAVTSDSQARERPHMPAPASNVAIIMELFVSIAVFRA